MRRILSFCWIMIAAMAASIPMKAVTVYFNNPANWATVKAYFYTKSQSAAQWPGTTMTAVNGVTGVYQVEVPTGYENAMVIFNNDDNGKQYPGANADGVQLAGKSMVCWADAENGDVTNASWTEYIDHAFTVYFDNTNTNYSTVKLYYWGFTPLANWDSSVSMENVQGKVYKYTTVPAGTVGVIFHDGQSGEGHQTADMVPVENHIYNSNGDQGDYTAPVVQEPFTVYFDNTAANWATPTIHYWGGTTESTYPGVAMTQEAGKMYKYTVPGGTTGILFNAGDGDASKTNNFVPQPNHVFTQAGDQGDKSSYVVTVETPAHLYALGTIGDTAWDTNGGVELVKVGATNTFKAENVAIKGSVAGATDGYFTLVTVRGANWDAVNASARYGATSADAVLTSGTAAPVMKYAGSNAGNAQSWKLPIGEYTIEMNFEAMTVKATLTKAPEAAGSATITLPEIEIEQGATEDLVVRIVSSIPMMGLQFELALPDAATSGITYGAPVLSDLMSANFTCQYNLVGGKLRFLIYSPSGEKFTRLNGALLYLPLTAAAEAGVAEHTVTMSNIIISDENMNQATVDGTVTGKVKVIAKSSEYTVALDVEEVALPVGGTKKLIATVTPSEGAPAVTWMSSNTAVATVAADGTVTAVANGTATITATCGTAKATARVTVGKLAQTITWEQTVTTLGIGESIDLVAATSTSDLEVEFVITNGANFATLAGNKLTAGNLPGTVTIQAKQNGNADYAPANPVTKTFTITLGYTLGDVNGDGNINTTDVTTTVAYILETLEGEALTNFNTKAADMDGNKTINIVDVNRIVALALQQAQSPAPKRAEGSMSGLEQFSLSGKDCTLKIDFSNMQNYIATQFDLDLDENQIVGAFITNSSHRVAFRNNDGFSRVLVYSEENEPFASDDFITVVLRKPAEGDISLNHAIVNSFENGAVVESPALGTSTTITGIETVEAENAAPVYYNLQGVRVSEPSAGLYIEIRGNKAQKVVIR